MKLNSGENSSFDSKPYVQILFSPIHTHIHMNENSETNKQNQHKNNKNRSNSRIQRQIPKSNMNALKL